MGRLVIEDLLQRKRSGSFFSPSAVSEIVMSNRGVSPHPFTTEIKNKEITHLIGDRRNPDEFKKLISGAGSFDVIVDFTSFRPEDLIVMKEALTNLDGTYKVGHYIFISSDSSYQSLPIPNAHNLKLTEDCCPSPKTPEEEDEVKTLATITDSGAYQYEYGRRKRLCDDYLTDQWEKNKFPFTSLRLVDVYGPYDNLGEFWNSIFQPIFEEQPIPIYMGSDRLRFREGRGDLSGHQMSLFYGPDIGPLVQAVVVAADKVKGEILNIAHKETIALLPLCLLSSLYIGKTVQFDHEKDSVFPFTDFGAVDVSKSLKLLKFRYTPLPTGIMKTIQWYKEGDNEEYHRQF